MKKIIFTLLFFALILTSIRAQNLVPNGSFETKDPSMGCPFLDAFDVGKPQYWSGYITPDNYDLSGDYFNPCVANNGQQNYPGLNQAGCVLPLDGQSYCGFYAFSVNLFSPKVASEYIKNSNIQLTAGQQYYVEFYVFNAQGNHYLGWPSTAASNRIGAYFTPNPSGLSSSQSNGLNALIPQIPNIFPSSNYYGLNTSGWQKISGYFTPQQTGTWTMVIGNFDPGMNNITTNPCNSNNTSPNPDLGGLKTGPGTRCIGQDIASYYYVDAVTVIPTNQTHPSYGRIIFGPSLICSTGTFSLQNAPPNTMVTWSSSSPSDLSIDPTTGVANHVSSFSGYVTVSATFGACGDSVSKAVWVGSASNSAGLSVSGSATPIPTGLYNYRLLGLLPAEEGPFTYSWRIPSGNGWSFFTQNLNTTSVDVWVGTTEGSVEVYWSNACGLTGTYLWVTPSGSGGGGGGGGPGPLPEIVISPNPSTTTVNVKVAESLNHHPLNQHYQLFLADKFGRKVFSVQSDEKNFDIPVSHLPEDIYYLNLIYKDVMVRKQIVIKR